MESSKFDVTLDKKYGLIKKLGNGLTSVVYLAADLQTDTKVALKIMKCSTKSFQSEIEALTEIENPNVIKLISSGCGALSRKGLPNINNLNYIALEYAEKGELFDYLSYPDIGFGEKIGKFIFREIIKGISAINAASYCHRDIKLENILLDCNYDIKIADFGFAMKVQENKKVTNCLGTPNYAAPEILMKKSYDPFKSDIYSLGIVLFMLVTCKSCFKQANRDDRFYRMFMQNKVKEFWIKLKNLTDEIDELSENFRDLFTKMCAFNPEERPSLEEILKHPWMDTNDYPDVAEVKEELINRNSLIFQQKQLEKMKEYNSEEICTSFNE